MATKKPICNYNGQLKELQAGDTLPGGGSSPLMTKGDLWGYTTADARVPVGTDGQHFVADSTQSAGVAWVDDFATALIIQRNFT